MGKETQTWTCRFCGNLHIWNGKYKYCNCSKMKFKQMEKGDFEHMNNGLQGEKNENLKKEIYEYWQIRVNGRLKELEPLIYELKEKNITLLSLSRELNEEYIELNNVKLFYKF